MVSPAAITVEKFPSAVHGPATGWPPTIVCRLTLLSAQSTVTSFAPMLCDSIDTPQTAEADWLAAPGHAGCRQC
jgi:hypothetical protein